MRTILLCCLLAGVSFGQEKPEGEAYLSLGLAGTHRVSVILLTYCEPAGATLGLDFGSGPETVAKCEKGKWVRVVPAIPQVGTFQCVTKDMWKQFPLLPVCGGLNTGDFSLQRGPTGFRTIEPKTRPSTYPPNPSTQWRNCAPHEGNGEVLCPYPGEPEDVPAVKKPIPLCIATLTAGKEKCVPTREVEWSCSDPTRSLQVSDSREKAWCHRGPE